MQLKSIYLTISIILCQIVLMGQTTTNQPDSTKQPVYLVVEVAAEFPGGTNALMKYVTTNRQYPAKAKAEKRGGIPYVTFVIEIDGSITDVKILKPVPGGPDLDEEAMRIVKSMPNWKPGTQNGKPVRVQFNLPIRFSPNM